MTLLPEIVFLLVQGPGPLTGPFMACEAGGACYLLSFAFGEVGKEPGSFESIVRVVRTTCAKMGVHNNRTILAPGTC